MKGTNTDNYKFKLFLEGVEVIFISASVNYTQGGGVCNISIPASGAMANVYARTQVQLFYMNEHDNLWKILFSGEVHNVRFSKGSKGTSMSLYCLDLSSYFDQLYRYYMRDADPYSVNQKVIRVFSASKSSRSNYVNALSGYETATIDMSDSGKDKLKNITYLISDMKVLVNNILTPMLDTNDYTRKLRDIYRIRETIYSLEDKFIGETFSGKAVQEMLSSYPLSNMETVRTAIKNATSTIYYNMVISNPSYVNGFLRSILYVPDSPMIPPPMCNVIYPNQAQLVDCNLALAAAPTRISLTSDSFLSDSKDNFYTYSAIAPKELTDKSGRSQYLHGEITEAEAITGIMPIVRRTTLTSKLMGMSKLAEQPSNNEYGLVTMVHIAEYELMKNQLANNNASSSGMPFNPNLVAGLNCAIMTDPIIVRGKLISVNHSISKSSYTTSISLSHSKISPLADTTGMADEDNYNLLDWSSQNLSSQLISFLKAKGDYANTFPAFINKDFLPQKSSEGYMKLIGVKSSTDAALISEPNNTPMISAIRKLHDEYELYKEAENEFMMVKSVTERPVATMLEFYDFYKQGIPAIGHFETDNLFNETRQSVIIRHNMEVDGVKI